MKNRNNVNCIPISQLAIDDFAGLNRTPPKAKILSQLGISSSNTFIVSAKNYSKVDNGSIGFSFAVERNPATGI